MKPCIVKNGELSIQYQVEQSQSKRKDYKNNDFY